VDVPAQSGATAVLMKRGGSAPADPREQLAEILKHAPHLAAMPAAEPNAATVKAGDLRAQLLALLGGRRGA
jgi:hypothetical protein